MCKCQYCGKEFNNYQGLAGHKSHCKLNPNYDEEKRKQRYKEISQKSGNTIKSINLLNKQKDELTRKERKLICQRCGKEYILNLTDKEFSKEKYSKYCSRSCANVRHHSEETKQKISRGVKNSEKFYINNQIAINNRIKKFYKEKPDKNISLKTKNKIINKTTNKVINKIIINKKYICKECGKEFKLTNNRDISSKIYCSKECKHKYLSKHTGGYRVGSGFSKSGWYKGIKCDSTWELAFLIYHLDNNLYIERCKESRKYIYHNKEHIYYPDFITDKGIIEIKGYRTEQSEEKRKQNPDIINIFKQDIQFYLDYIKNKYDKPLIELYDNSKPNIDFLNNNKYIWMHNDQLNKNTMIYPIKYQEYINKGWVHGRKKYKK